MIRILRTDLYRLFRSKVFLLILLLNFLGMIADVVWEGFSSSNVFQVQFWNLFQDLNEQAVFAFTGIVLMVLYGAEQKHGFVKYSYSCSGPRRHLSLSKFVVGVVAALCFIVEDILNKLIQPIIVYLFFRKKYNMSTLKQYYWLQPREYEVRNVFFAVFTTLAALAVILLIYELTGSMVGGIILSLVWGSGLLEETLLAIQTFLRILRALAGKSIDKGLNLQQYLLFTGSKQMNWTSPESVLKVAIPAGILLIGSVAAAAVVAEKKSVNG